MIRKAASIVDRWGSRAGPLEFRLRLLATFRIEEFFGTFLRTWTQHSWLLHERSVVDHWFRSGLRLIKCLRHHYRLEVIHGGRKVIFELELLFSLSAWLCLLLRPFIL